MMTMSRFGNQTVEGDALQRACADGSLELLFQPELDLDSGAIVAMEGLLRWRHESLGQLKPADFIELAISCGVMADIDAWVLRAGATEVAGWQSLPGPSRHLWLNVSVEQLKSPGFVQMVAEVVAAHGLFGGLLGLEISEKGVLELGDEALPLLLALRDAGVSLAIDDFTSFYATLGAISALPVDCVKLGHRYVRGVGDEDHDDSFVTSVIKQAHAHGMYVVAEGVETWSESARLTELGCDRAHGYLFASAQRSDRARWLLTQGTGWRGYNGAPAKATPFPTPRHAHT